MKFRIISTIVVLAILVILYAFTSSDDSASYESGQDESMSEIQ